MRKLFGEIDELLRGGFTRGSDLDQGRVGIALDRLVLIGLAMGAIYGAFMGLYGVLRPSHPSLAQMTATAVKVPALFFLTLLVTFPSLYVVSALARSKLRFLQTLKLLLTATAVNLALLASFGPVTGFFTLSTENYPFMIVLNVVIFTVCGLVSLGFLRRVLAAVFIDDAEAPAPVEPEGLRPDGSQPATTASLLMRAQRPPAAGGGQRRIFVAWGLLYGAVGAQMGWILRPFIGSPNRPFTLFRDRESNFFEAFFGALGQLFG